MTYRMDLDASPYDTALPWDAPDGRYIEDYEPTEAEQAADDFAHLLRLANDPGYAADAADDEAWIAEEAIAEDDSPF